MEVYGAKYPEGSLFFTNSKGVSLNLYYDKEAGLGFQIRRVGELSNHELNSVFFREKANLKETIEQMITHIEAFKQG